MNLVHGGELLFQQTPELLLTQGMSGLFSCLSSPLRRFILLVLLFLGGWPWMSRSEWIKAFRLLFSWDHWSIAEDPWKKGRYLSDEAVRLSCLV